MKEVLEVPTYAVFLDLPIHVEYRIPDLPLLTEGTIIEFKLSLRNPRDPSQIREISGPYFLKRRKLVYSNEQTNREGLTQYLEWSPIPKMKNK